MDEQPHTIATHAARHPDRPAVIEAATGAVTTYAELDDRSRRLATRLAAAGLGVGDTVAVLLPNGHRYFEAVWAAQRAGLYYVPVNWHLTGSEVGYVVADSGAGGLVADASFGPLVAQAAAELVPPAVQVLAGVPSSDPRAYEPAAGMAVGAGGADGADGAGSPEVDGAVMLYSSGTTGRPKGIRRAITGAPFGQRSFLDVLLRQRYGFGEDTVYLSPAPLYHAAPLGWAMATHRLGGTVVVMDHFDPEGLLEAVARYRVSHVQMVPTMFVRLCKLPEPVRRAADLSSVRGVIHAAAPCPMEVKRQMLKWWGPIVHEYYAGSEGNGFCAIAPDEWLAHPGSVGRPLYGELHIVGDDGHELPPGEIGTIYFGGTAPFEYHNDPEKTRLAFNDAGWSTLGDLGYVDEDGYLYLSDRRTNLIISGGVNIYPREVEDVLVLHPAVADAAVVGEPDEDLGQAVLAVVQPVDPAAAGDDLARALVDHCREHLARFKCPRRVLFDPDLPRTPTGKLAKRRLIERLFPTT